MRWERKHIYTLLFLAFAIGCATLTGYLLSILWLGEWKYRELIAPIWVTTIAVIASAAVVAVINQKQRNLFAIAGLTAVIVAGCVVVATSLFFGILANCNLSCGTRIEAESRSPTGLWRAVRFSTNCTSIARYCRPIAHVSIVSEGQAPRGNTGNAFSIDATDGVELLWKSDQLLLIRYPLGSRVLRQEKAVGAVRVEYLPVVGIFD
jgi:hypothetical protein